MEKKRERSNKTYTTFGIAKEPDGWVAVKTVAQTNGRCKTEKMMNPDVKTLAIEKCKKLQSYEWF